VLVGAVAGNHRGASRAARAAAGLSIPWGAASGRPVASAGTSWYAAKGLLKPPTLAVLPTGLKTNTTHPCRPGVASPRSHRPWVARGEQRPPQAGLHSHPQSHPPGRPGPSRVTQRATTAPTQPLVREPQENRFESVAAVGITSAPFQSQLGLTRGNW